MIRFVFALFSLFIGACSSKDNFTIPAGSVQRIFELDDFDAVASIYLPPEMDSTSTWTLDCCTGNGPVRGFWDRSRQIIQPRSGFCFQKFKPDSLSHVLIVHSNIQAVSPPLTDSIQMAVIERQNHRYAMISSPPLEVLFYDLEQVDSSKIAYYGIKNKLLITETKPNQLPRETLFAVFQNPDGRCVYMTFECQGATCDSFAVNMLPYARTLRFSLK
jgi:hypothetical protein